MLSKIQVRLTYANVVATLALMFAMTGGAFAAGHYLITSTKQISPKVIKSLKGKAGAKGSSGPAGAAGPQGPAGPKGDAGAPGKDGAPGDEGAAGKDGAQGKQGIQGIEGKAGKDGSPWTVGGTLPSGSTETGTWGFNTYDESGLVLETFSFPIPLSTPLEASKVLFLTTTEIENKEHSTECPGTPEEPKAAAGYFCLYEKTLASAELFVVGPPATSGIFAYFKLAEGEKTGFGAVGLGTWAVTAP
jgi:hypothetical protein